MPKFNKAKILQENTAVKVNSENEAIALLKWAHSEGLKWTNGETYIKTTRWHKRTKNLTYYLHNGTFGTRKKSSDGYTVYDYKDAIDA